MSYMSFRDGQGYKDASLTFQSPQNTLNAAAYELRPYKDNRLRSSFKDERSCQKLSVAKYTTILPIHQKGTNRKRLVPFFVRTP
ncbi:hypothetical protein [Paenibacillus foliorum]|uniref:hypothetical protein n=1 Tax=Paenibacillus foliorum TaxID=2654974 RepID=UPI001C11DB37|nr:hypothetical protein [Paenibacillus foliorum]